MSVGVFQLVKNEAMWVGPWIERIGPWVDEIVVYDGDSTDGTPEILKAAAKRVNANLRLFRGKDCENLQEAYERLSNECMWELHTDWAWFLHPDMWVVNPEKIRELAKDPSYAAVTHIRSFAGDPDGAWKEICGRGDKWKNIYRLRNPNLGAHYHGHYGAHNEDVYFEAITGSDYQHYGTQMDLYPYEVGDIGLEVLHFSDVRPVERRIQRMERCLENQGYKEKDISLISSSHPRVTLKSGAGFEFIPAKLPQAFVDSFREWSAYAETLQMV